MKFSIVNLGCKVNAYEAESSAQQLEQSGWQRVSMEEEPDATVIFTCAVTNTAAAKSRKILHRAKRIKEDEITAVVGCYVQVDDGLLDEADILVGTANKARLAEYVDTFSKNHEKIRDIQILQDVAFESMTSSNEDSKARCDLKIQDGCNQFCAYCIIPYARGRERSMHPDFAVAEAKRLSRKYHEIVLTGIHTGRYGKEYGVTLTELLQRMLDNTTNTRFRISSIEVTEVTDELIALMKKDHRIARFLHIPLQSGCDKILRSMRRPYTTEEFYERIEWVRSELPGVSISTDLITGFPGETDEDFEETFAFLKKCNFSFLHVFPYSVREGTVAANMPCQVAPQIKKERARKCIALSGELADSYRSQFAGEEDWIICEYVKDGYTTGHTSAYIPVKINEELVHGEWEKVKLESYENHMMIARKVSDTSEFK